MPSRDILEGEASTQELPPRFEETFRQLIPTTPQEAGAKGDSPTREQSCRGVPVPSPPQNLQHLLASRRGYASLGNTFRAQEAALSSASEDLTTVKDGTPDYIQMGLGSLS